MALSAGFLPDPYVVDGISVVGEVESQCGGWVDRKPALVLSYEAGDRPLAIRVQSVTESQCVALSAVEVVNGTRAGGYCPQQTTVDVRHRARHRD